MPDEVWLTAAAISTFLGMGWLALAKDVHWVQVYADAPRSPRAAIILRCLGSAALTTALVLCVLADTPAMAILVWMMQLALAAIVVALVLSRRPRMLAPLAPFRRRATQRR
jgi:hypothetical protein